MNLAQFWDGRAKDLKEQAGGPIITRRNGPPRTGGGCMRSIPQYRAEFKRVFGSDEVKIDMVTEAIAAFETLVTPNSVSTNG